MSETNLSRLTSDDRSSLRRELEAARVFQHHSARTLAKFTIFLASAIAMVTVMATAELWLCALLSPLAGFLAASAAVIGHEGAHRSFSASVSGNEVLFHAAFPLWGGVGTQHWKHKHNRNHHGFPNIDGIDDDINLWPMATSTKEHEASGPARRWFQRHLQGTLFWPLSFFFLAGVMRLQSVLFLVRAVRAGRTDRAIVADASCQLLHYVLWLGLAGALFGWGRATLVYVLVWFWVGLFLAMVFTPAHLGLPIYDDRRHGWEHQIRTTRNLIMPRWLAFCVCGLDYQLEHHLFPRIPHQNLPRASSITARFCRKHGLPHRSIDFRAGLLEVSQFMGRGWRVDSVANDEPAI